MGTFCNIRSAIFLQLSLVWAGHDVVLSLKERHELAPLVLNKIYDSLDQGFTTFEDLSAHKNLIHEEGQEINQEEIPVQIEKKKFNDHKYGSSITYGEVMYDELYDLTNKALSQMNVSEDGGETWDIGSGTGKVLMQQFLERDFDSVTGIELVERRYNISVQALKALQAMATDDKSNLATFVAHRLGTDNPKFENVYRIDGKDSGLKGSCLVGKGRKICVINGDALKDARGINSANFVYTCSQCLPPSVLAQLTKTVLSELPAGAGLASLAKLPEEVAEESGLDYKGSIKEHVYKYNLPEGQGGQSGGKNGKRQDVWIYRHRAAGNTPLQAHEKATRLEKGDKPANVHLYTAM